jgi:hypothetical protein
MVSSSVTVGRVVEFVDVGRGSRFVENIPSFFYIRLAKSTKKAKRITQAFPESKGELESAWG